MAATLLNDLQEAATHHSLQQPIRVQTRSGQFDVPAHEIRTHPATGQLVIVIEKPVITRAMYEDR